MNGLLKSGVIFSFVLCCTASRASIEPMWEKVGSDDGIETYRREVEGSPIIALRGVGVIDASISRVASAILDPERATEWVENLEESRLVKMYSETEFLEYNHIGTPIVLKDRDFLYRGKVESDLKTGELTITFRSVEDPAVPVGKYIRGDLKGIWKLTPVDGGRRTRVLTEMHGDPKGTVPKWIVNLFQKGWPRKTLESLRRQVAKPDIKIIPQVEAFFRLTTPASAAEAPKR